MAIVKRATTVHLPSLFGLGCVFVATSLLRGEPLSMPLYSFEEKALDASVTTDRASISLTSGVGVTDGVQALRIEFTPDISQSSVKFTPDTAWDCEELGPYRFSFAATNAGESSIHLRASIATAKGVTLRRSISVAPGASDTIYFELAGDRTSGDHGMRDEPPSLPDCGRKMLTQGVKPRANPTRIRSITLHVDSAAQADVLVIDDLKFISNPPVDKNYLTGIVDKFGQRAGVEFPGKVDSEEELRAAAQAELAELEKTGALPDRSRYGGWSKGPRLKATGYFRAEKHQGRWSLVDPDGYLYFATGLANIRMANTSTFTGVDFKDPSVRYRDPDDVTPEDSIGIVPSSAEARATSYVAYPDRRRMLTWLPDYSDPLAKHYGYRRSRHKGPFPHGEVFSFYRANLERKYGTESLDETMAKWRQVTVDRMKNWGFTCLGNWADASFYQGNNVPYFANGWIIGDFKTVSTGYDYWGPMPDPFDPEFAKRALATTRVIAEEVQDNPWCVGVFIDNEKSWGNLNSTASRHAIAINTINRSAEDSPTKAAFVKALRKKYDSVAALADAWGVEIASWEAFKKGFDVGVELEDPELLADLSMLSAMYAEEYFRIVHDALASVLPNHMYLGCRMTPWGMTPEVWRAASRYCDVMSYNYYREFLGSKQWDFLPEIDRPSIIGEWHMGATDTGLPHCGIIHAANQHDRGEMYKVYMDSVIANPYFVGAHWFQYIDSPITGRAHDGENYNVGFVNVADVPYKPLVDAAREFNRDLYPRVYGKAGEE